MRSTSPVTIEAHRSAATMYATGDLTPSNLSHAIAYVEQLPEHICALCVDLTGVRRTDPEALRILEATLASWRAVRWGMTYVKQAGVSSGHSAGVVTRSLRECAGSETR